MYIYMIYIYTYIYIYIIVVLPTALVTFCDTKTKRRGYVSKLELVAAAQKDPEAEIDDILEKSSKHLKHQYKHIDIININTH